MRGTIADRERLSRLLRSPPAGEHFRFPASVGVSGPSALNQRVRRGHVFCEWQSPLQCAADTLEPTWATRDATNRRDALAGILSTLQCAKQPKRTRQRSNLLDFRSGSPTVLGRFPRQPFQKPHGGSQRGVACPVESIRGVLRKRMTVGCLCAHLRREHVPRVSNPKFTIFTGR